MTTDNNKTHKEHRADKIQQKADKRAAALKANLRRRKQKAKQQKEEQGT